jgi:ribosomal 50S subunit-recycling heat shock protein
MLKRLNKYISDSGFCSRREADALIEKGSVQVNGHAAELGTKIGIDDKVTVDGKLIESVAEDKTDRVYLLTINRRVLPVRLIEMFKVILSMQLVFLLGFFLLVVWINRRKV